MKPILKTIRRTTFLCVLLVWGWQGYAQTHDKLFTLLPPEKTQVFFENTIKDTREHNILIYANYYGGAGVGIADFDKDGFQDIFFTGNLVGDRLYLNKGEMHFEDITDVAGIKDNGGWSSGVAIADVNNDGWLDIYVCRELYDDQPELRKNKLYINNGDVSAQGVTFTECAEKYGLADDHRSRHATFLDYDKDGDLDLFLLNQPPNPGNFSDLYDVKTGPEFSPRLYRNDGATFANVTEQAGVLKGGYPNSVTASDLNNDGWTDLYIANDFESPDFLYLNNGDGTFTNIIDDAMKHISYFSMGVDAADINNDGWLDLMVVDMVAEDNYRLKANMSGMNPQAFWDVVNEGGHYQYMFNTLQMNNGVLPTLRRDAEGREVLFSDIAQLTGVSNTDWSWSNLMADFDNDGYKDIYVTNGLMRDIRNTDSNKEVSKYVENVAYAWIQNNPNAGEVSIWDILDLEEALSLVPSEKLSNYAFKNQGAVPGRDLTFEKMNEEWGLDDKTFSNGSAYADLDNDGDLDLVVNNVNEVAHIYQNNAEKLASSNYFRVKLTDHKEHKPIFGARVKIEHQGKTQWFEVTNVRGMYSTSEFTAHFGVGNAPTIDKVIITWPEGKETVLTEVSANQVVSVDREDAQKVKENALVVSPLFEKTEAITYQHRENDFDDFEKQVLLPHKMSQFGPALAVADVNGDGLEDAFTGAATGHSAQLFIQRKNGNFSEENVSAFAKDAIYEDLDAAFFDADNDGDLDLYVVSGGNAWEPYADEYQDRLYLNDGKGNFSKSEKSLPAMKESGSVVRPFDYDNDGDLDLFVGGRHVPWDYPAPATSSILQNENGTFKDVTKSVAKDLMKIGLVTDAVWTDFDQDGTTDLILVGEWMPITFIQYDGKKFSNATAEFGVKNSEGWWYSIEVADMDNDGDEDLIAGNLGLNYKYKATAQEPFEVHYDDFDENGAKDIVLSYYNFGEQVPLRGRSCSSEQVPMLAQKFKTYDLFASSNLVEVYGENNLQQALHLQAKTFATAYLENEGNGKFTMAALPNEAQLSSVNDMIIDDLDGDGAKDILIAGNLFTSEIETTRNDAGIGLFLKGDGKGIFKPVPAAESGFYLPYDVKKLALLKTTKDKLILSANNSDPLVAFKIFSTKKAPTGSAEASHIK